MIRLIAVEAHRWRARRAMWATLLVGLVLALMTGAGFALAARPPAGAEVAQGKAAFQQIHDDWVQHHDEMVAQCEAAVPASDKAKCAEMNAEPKESDFVPQPMSWVSGLGAAAGAAGTLGPLLALIAAASFWGADYRHGTLATWLTFVPNRARVFASKMIVVAASGALITFVMEVLLLGIAAASVVGWQGTTAATGDTASVVAVAARAVGLGAMTALLGGALAVIFRQTMAPSLLPLGYMLVSPLAGLLALVPGLSGISAWLPENNIRAYIEGGTTLQVPEQHVTANGLEVTMRQIKLSFEQGLTYVLIALAVMVAAAWWSFRRRDVN